MPTNRLGSFATTQNVCEGPHKLPTTHDTPAYFRPVVLIPVYNHPETVKAVVDEVVRLKLPVIVIDDGSELGTAKACDRCQGELVQVIHRRTNGGKGAALITGMQAASIADYTHVITLDSDGQMDPKAIPQLLKLGRRFPHYVIASYPQAHDCLPAARRAFRAFSNVLANINALSWSIEDAHCGLRLYPLPAICQLLARIHPGRHMQFDPEILIRLLWLGVPLKNVPMQFTKPKDGLSHFSPWLDPCKILWMHSRLFVTMLTRFPLIMICRLTGWHTIPSPKKSTLS